MTIFVIGLFDNMYKRKNDYAKITQSSVSSLKFAWWNGSFKYLDEVQLNDAIWVAQQLKNQQYDFIALGEIDVSQQEQLAQFLADENYEIKFGLEKKGKTVFDICWLIRKATLSQTEDAISLYITWFEKNLKVAYKVSLSTFDNTQIIVYIVHWSSLLHNTHADDKHMTIARKMREDLNLYFHNNIHQNVILMGDFNAEPYSQAMVSGLEATRDYDYARKRSSRLYNPFWGLMTKNHAHQYNGSYFYPQDEITHWHTFDQILVSSSFLKQDDNWQFKIPQKSIFSNHQLIKYITNGKHKFDHLPVTCELIKVFQNDGLYPITQNRLTGCTGTN